MKLDFYTNQYFNVTQKNNYQMSTEIISFRINKTLYQLEILFFLSIIFLMGSVCSNLRACNTKKTRVGQPAEYSKKTSGGTQKETFNTQNITASNQARSRKDSFNDLQKGQKNHIVCAPLKLKPITMKELQKHDSERSAWTSYKGIVYDVTKYLKKHPGGIKKLLRGCGKECDRLFGIYHQNVDAEALLKDDLVGYLVKQKNEKNIEK